MSDQNPDKAFDCLVHRALVPKGLRPRTNEEIEQLLDTIGGAPLSDEKLKRMLRKIDGEEKILPRSPRRSAPAEAALTADERELVAMYRAQGKSLPPELAAKLKAMEERAAQPPDDEAERDG